MKNSKFLIFMSVLMALAVIPMGIDNAAAGPGSVVNPADGFAYPTYYANSPTNLRKFVDGLPRLNTPNNLGQQLPVAVADKTTYLGSDYYEIGLKEYWERMHRDLPYNPSGRLGTYLRGYYQKNAPDGSAAGVPHYLGPVIVATRDKPVRIKFVNELPVGIDFFMPVDKTVLGSGDGNKFLDGTPGCNPLTALPGICAEYSQSRAGIHLHGGFTPWISDGTPHQWITPALDITKYPVGDSARDVPDMNPIDPVNYIPSGGSVTLYYPNQQSARLMFYHEHAYGTTRLMVYAGVAAGYLLQDPAGIGEWTLPGFSTMEQIPLVIQDKTFVPSNIDIQDSLWMAGWAHMSSYGLPGDLWFPHVYEPNQDPSCAWGIDCMNPLGRWDYGPWIWPPAAVLNPVLPQPSVAPEAFMDVMVVNGTVYPTITVQPKAYRLRILNASNDRSVNLQLYYAITGATNGLSPNFDVVTGTACDAPGKNPLTCTEVAMVPRDGKTYNVKRWGYTSTVPLDGRPGGVPDPTNAGPKMVQIGNEGGLLPQSVEKNAPPIPITYDTDPKSMTVGNVIDGTFLLGPAERADVVVDFSQVKSGSTLILYNDAPAAWPAGDQRYDYYTFGPDWTQNGGAPSTLPGFAPNTRTVMQFVVQGTAAPAYNFAALATALPGAYGATQDPPLVPQAEYASAFPTLTMTPNQYVKINQTASFSYTDSAGQTVTLPIHQKAIAEEFDPIYGRMSAMLGTEAVITNNQGQNTFGFFYVDPATEVIPAGETQLWKITHNGVDTHAIHFHLVNVQVVNRVDWAGVVKPPDPNELGWKETVRMNPLEDIIVAMKPVPPKLPFTVPTSTRLRDVTQPEGWISPAWGQNFTDPWPYAQPQGTNPPPDPAGTTTVNQLTDFGWEYVWHCHLLGHEENDMMRPFVMTNATNYNTADIYAPTVTVTPASGSTIDPNSTISLTATDTAPQSYLVSGVASISYAINGACGGPFTTVPGSSANINGPFSGSSITICYYATDQAATPNNSTTQTATFPVVGGGADTAPPILTWGAKSPAANANGWNNTQPVSILYTATDPSGVGSSTPASPLTFTAESANQTQTVNVCDSAPTPNCANYTSPVVNIDLTAPTVTAYTTPTGVKKGAAGSTVTVKVSGNVTDTLSGVDFSLNVGQWTLTDSKSGGVPPSPGTSGNFTVASNGTYSFSVIVSRENSGAARRIYTFTIKAPDRAGNLGTATTTFYVQ